MWFRKHLFVLNVSALLGALLAVAPTHAEEPAAVEVNQPAPDFSVTDGSGDAVKLSDYREKYLVLTFNRAHW